MRLLSKQNDRSIDGMFVFCNPFARAELHQQKRARKRLGGKRGAGVPGYGVRGPGLRGPGV